MFTPLYDLTDCPIGYHSINCSEICSFPSFGEDCQDICKCDIGLCDFRFGCTKYNGMVFLTQMNLQITIV